MLICHIHSWRTFFLSFHAYRTELICVLNDPELKDIPQTKHKYINITKHGETE